MAPMISGARPTRHNCPSYTYGAIVAPPKVSKNACGARSDQTPTLPPLALKNFLSAALSVTAFTKVSFLYTRTSPLALAQAPSLSPLVKGTGVLPYGVHASAPRRIVETRTALAVASYTTEIAPALGTLPLCTFSSTPCEGLFVSIVLSVTKAA